MPNIESKVVHLDANSANTSTVSFLILLQDLLVFSNMGLLSMYHVCKCI